MQPGKAEKLLYSRTGGTFLMKKAEQPMVKRTTLQDIADLAGVTKMTVSKALRNQEGVSDGVKAKILKIAEELHYFSASRGLRGIRTGQVAVLVPEIFMKAEEIFYTSIFKCLYAEAIKKNYYLTLYVVSRREKQKPVLPPICQADKVDGIILLGQLPLEYVKLVSSIAIPSVLLNSNYEAPGLNCICTDNIEGMYKATKYLIERGHTKIGFVGNIRLAGSIRDRYLGYYRALIESGIRADSRFILKERDDANNDIELALPAEMPTAFVCSSDQAAFRLMETLEKKNLRIPEDVSVIGFDDTLYSIASHPKLTTVSVNRKSMAENAVAMILDLLENSSMIPRKVVVGTAIIDRNSVAGPRRAG
ncbi:MAG TPA: transcriptional regulator [Ruminococcaceae bacterium]|jgi:LacI family transcriptional regulator|nr:transcriptional regulator [Oscillospiraceae bacterium]